MHNRRMDAQNSLLEQVRAHLAETKGSWPKVAHGAQVDYFTVVRIGSGKAKSPRYATIQKLADYFERERQAA